MSFDFALLTRSRPRQTYSDTVGMCRRGLLSLGFLWEIARHDEVFSAYLRKQGVDRP